MRSRSIPTFAAAVAALGWAHFEAAAAGWSEFRADEVKQAETLAEKASGARPHDNLRMAAFGAA